MNKLEISRNDLFEQITHLQESAQQFQSKEINDRQF